MVGNLQDYHHGRKEAIGFQCQVNLVLLVLGIQDYHHGRKEGSNWFSMSGQPGTASAGYTRLPSWKEGSNWFSMSGQPGTVSAGYTRLSS